MVSSPVDTHKVNTHRSHEDAQSTIDATSIQNVNGAQVVEDGGAVLLVVEQAHALGAAPVQSAPDGRRCRGGRALLAGRRLQEAAVAVQYLRGKVQKDEVAMRRGDSEGES